MLWVVSPLYITSVLFQIGCYYTLYNAWKAYCSPTTPTSLFRPPVSVIVCAHNELDNLQTLLPLLLQQQYSTFEIVVVEDTSYDGTLDFLLGEKEKYPQINIVWVRHRPDHVQGKKYALTLGIRAAQYDQLLLTDADCRPVSPHWISSMVEQQSGKCDFVLGYSPYERHTGMLNSFIRYETLHTGLLYIGAALKGHPYMGVGRNLAYRKLFFLEKGGFQGFWHVTGGDDDLFVNRHASGENTAVAIQQEALVYSVPKTKWAAYIRQKVRHLSVGKWYKKKDQRWLGLLSATTIATWVGWGYLLICDEWIWPTVLLLSRWWVIGLALRAASAKLNDPISMVKLPIFDFLYVIYYISIGPTALLSKHIRWK
uniref:Glycosyltransferase n=1 Tax=Roseihalotalea indica TaxID=2867963 RepID=A0AA49GRZ3_9BACT|nr:glycosyltransferase [Tunicatimonas sp. TK19036]